MSFGFGLMLLCFGCGAGLVQPAATPSITQVMPATIVAGSQNVTMKVTGNNLTNQAVILWNGSALATSMVDSNTLAGTVSSSSLAKPSTAQLQVQNTATMELSSAVPVVITPPASSQTTSPLSVSTASLPSGTVGVSYSTSLTAVGGTPAYAWSVAAGQLPAGLSLSSNGLISGTPTASGITKLVIMVGDSASQTASVNLVLSVAAAAAATPLKINSSELPGATGNQPYSTTLNATGGTAPYSWSIAWGNLPAGVSLNPASGVLSGTPTASGNFSLGVTVQDAGSPSHTAAATLALSVAAPAAPLKITSSGLAGATTNQPYSATLSATGGTAPYSWSINTGKMTGFGVNQSTGVLSGTPTASGNFPINVTVMDSAKQTATAVLSLSVAAAATPLKITSSGLTGGTANQSYSAALGASGGTTPYTWSITSGSLPAGVSLNPATGVLAGTPTASGNFPINVTVMDSAKQTATAVLSLSVAAAATPLKITSSGLTGGTANQSYSAALGASGGTTPYTWSITSGSLPAGVSLNPATGVLAGTPTASGNFPINVTVMDSAKQTATAVLSLSVAAAATPLKITSSGLTGGTANQSYSAALGASGGTTPYTWSITSGSLPAGVSLNPATGVLAGTPTASGTYNPVVTVKDAGSPSQTAAAKLAISIGAAAAPLKITSSALAGGTANQSYSAALGASGGTAPYSWSITSGSLPAGVSLNPATGVLAGTPTASGKFNLGVSVKDVSSPSQTAAATLAIFVADAVTPLKITSSVLAGATANQPYSAAVSATGGTPPYLWSVGAGGIPAGLSLGANNGVVSGTPTGTGTVSFIAVVKDSAGTPQTQSAKISFAVTSVPLSITSSTLAGGTDGVYYSSSMAVSGGTPAYTWSIASGSLPAGLSLSATSGAITGTPSATGTFNVTLAVSDNTNPAQHQAAKSAIVVAAAVTQPTGPGMTWYVRPDGGTRYSSNMTSGQCNGKYDASYASTGGKGVNQNCAFNDVRYLWQDGSYTVNFDRSVFPAYGWIGSGGDTYIIRGSIGTGVSYRVGWNNNTSSWDNATHQYWGVQGDPYNSGIPAPLSGTASQHTRILGENYASCHEASAKTQLHGGYGIYEVLQMAGTSYVDVACLDITDFSACGRASQSKTCNPSPGTLDDFANTGISWYNNSTNDTLTDIHIHGLANNGMSGPTGTGMVFSYLDLIGNASSGWNADPNNGATGTGTLLVEHYNIAWNGCAEEYPIVDANPYQDCTDDNSGGYGDGFGTASVGSNPAWNVHFDQGNVYYNTQDGLDALHIGGSGSTMTVTRSMAYGNMGQQIKVGGAFGTATNNLIVTNCNAMRQDIPGTPAGYNSKLSDFCRAADGGIKLTVDDAAQLVFDNNTIYSANATAIDIECNYNCTKKATADFRNNIFVGFLNDAADGYPRGGTGDYSNPIYNGSGVDFFGNAGSFYSNNVTFHAKSNWRCPAAHEQNASCSDPQLVDETWHLYGYGNMAPSSGSSIVIGAGAEIPWVTVDFSGQTRGNPPSIGGYEQ